MKTSEFKDLWESIVKQVLMTDMGQDDKAEVGIKVADKIVKAALERFGDAITSAPGGAIYKDQIETMKKVFEVK